MINRSLRLDAYIVKIGVSLLNKSMLSYNLALMDPSILSAICLHYSILISLKAGENKYFLKKLIEYKWWHLVGINDEVFYSELDKYTKYFAVL